MKKIIREDKEKGIVQITIADERWYVRSTEDKKTKNPVYEYVPSVTWICSHYPKGIAFYKWLANNGWDEAEAIKKAAGDKGSKVHYAITDLIAGKEIAMDSKYMNPSTEKEEDLSLEEYECLVSFVEWAKAVKPKFIANEIVVWNSAEGYAGTIDCVAEIDKVKYIIDFKTGQNVWPEYELQLSAYKHADHEHQDAQLGILQLGYKRNKNGWKFSELDDKFNLFAAAKQIWKNETDGMEPAKKDFPILLSLKEKETPKK